MMYAAQGSLPAAVFEDRIRFDLPFSNPPASFSNAPTDERRFQRTRGGFGCRSVTRQTPRAGCHHADYRTRYPLVIEPLFWFLSSLFALLFNRLATALPVCLIHTGGPRSAGGAGMSLPSFCPVVETVFPF